MGSHSAAHIPVNFDMIVMQKQLDEPPEGTVLYKYASEYDVIREYNIQKQIFVRTCSNVVEMVVLETVKEWELRVAAYFANHVVGPLLVNVPTPEDPTRLRHITDITNDTTSKQVYEAMAKNIDQSRFPIHFVISARFNVKFSNLTHKVASDHTIRRIINAYKP